MKVILKQKQKKKEKEKDKEKDTSEKIRITIDEIQNRLMQHFQNHIGEKNKTNSEEIFQAVMGYPSEMFDSFARFYWFNIIQRIMRQLRSKDKCFIIKKDKGWFVLQSSNECRYYQGLCSSAISKLNKAKIRADDWVEQEKWKDMKVPPREKSINSPEEQKKPESLSSKVIKLWKGETDEN